MDTSSIEGPPDSSDEKIIEEVVARLRGSYPPASIEDHTRRVRAGIAGFASAPIRDFVGVLVERRVSADLHGATVPA